MTKTESGRICALVRHYVVGDQLAKSPTDEQLTLFVEEVLLIALAQRPLLRAISEEQDRQLYAFGLGALVAARFVTTPLGAKLSGISGTTQVKIGPITRTMTGLSPAQKAEAFESAGEELLGLISVLKTESPCVELFGAVRPRSRWPF